MDELTLHEVADELGVHYMTIYRYVRLGKLPARKQGREWRVARTDLDAMQVGAEHRGKGVGIPWEERFLRRVLAGDEAGAWGVVEAALAGGSTADGVLLGILAPALRRVGDLWERGDVGIEHEHIASAVTIRIVGRLGARFARRGRSRGTVVMGTTAEDLHALPVTIAAEVVRTAGFEVVDAGCRLPPAAFAAAAAAAPHLVAVGVGVTTTEQDEAIRDTISALHGAVEVPVILGGSGVRSGEHAESLGADVWASSAEHLVELLTELAYSTP